MDPTSLPMNPDTIYLYGPPAQCYILSLRWRFYDVLAKLRLKIMTFLSHMPSPMLVYALNTI